MSTSETLTPSERFARSQNGYEADAVFATNWQNETFRVSDPLTYSEALQVYAALVNLQGKGLLPQTKLFEVRSVKVGPDRPIVGPEIRSHDRYDGAPLNLQLTRPVTNDRGFSKNEDAARAAFRLHFGEVVSFTRHGVALQRAQGTGGWFFYPNGVAAAQGLGDLVKVCHRRKLVVQGGNGRWYVVAPEVLS
jgi:hypothetical protein